MEPLNDDNLTRLCVANAELAEANVKLREERDAWERQSIANAQRVGELEALLVQVDQSLLEWHNQLRAVIEQLRAFLAGRGG